jgi:hypothetical protein
MAARKVFLSVDNFAAIMQHLNVADTKPEKEALYNLMREVTDRSAKTASLKQMNDSVVNVVHSRRAPPPQYVVAPQPPPMQRVYDAEVASRNAETKPPDSIDFREAEKLDPISTDDFARSLEQLRSSREMPVQVPATPLPFASSPYRVVSGRAKVTLPPGTVTVHRMHVRGAPEYVMLECSSAPLLAESHTGYKASLCMVRSGPEACYVPFPAEHALASNGQLELTLRAPDGSTLSPDGEVLMFIVQR